MKKRFLIILAILLVGSGCAPAEIEPIDWGSGGAVEVEIPPTPVSTLSSPDRTVPRTHQSLDEDHEFQVPSFGEIPNATEAFILVKEFVFDGDPSEMEFEVPGITAFLGVCMPTEGQLTAFLIVGPPDLAESIRYELDLSDCTDLRGYQFTVNTNDPWGLSREAFDISLPRYASEFQLLGRYQVKQNIFWFDGEIFEKYVSVTFTE